MFSMSSHAGLRACGLAVAMACSTLLMPAPAHADKGAALERVAVVNVQRVLTETVEGKRELGKIEKSFKKAEARLKKKAEKLEKDFRDLQSKAAMLTQAELRKRQERLMRGQQELQQLSMEAEQDVMQQEALATERVYKKIAAMVKQIALEEGVQVVLVKSEMTILYSNPKLDLTNRVIVRYDKQHK